MIEEQKKPDKPPGKPDGPPGQQPPSGGTGYTVDVGGGSFGWLVAEASVSSGLAIGLIGGLFGYRIADDVKTSSDGGTGRILDVETAPYSIVGAVGIIG